MDLQGALASTESRFAGIRLWKSMKLKITVDGATSGRKDVMYESRNSRMYLLSGRERNLCCSPDISSYEEEKVEMHPSLRLSYGHLILRRMLQIRANPSP